MTNVPKQVTETSTSLFEDYPIADQGITHTHMLQGNGQWAINHRGPWVTGDRRLSIAKKLHQPPFGS